MHTSLPHANHLSGSTLWKTPGLQQRLWGSESEGQRGRRSQGRSPCPTGGVKYWKPRPATPVQGQEAPATRTGQQARGNTSDTLHLCAGPARGKALGFLGRAETPCLQKPELRRANCSAHSRPAEGAGGHQWLGRRRTQGLPRAPLLSAVSVQPLSRVRLFATPWTGQASPSITNSWSLLKPRSIELVMPSSHLILCRPHLLLPQSLPASESSPMSQLFSSGGQSIGVSASA